MPFTKEKAKKVNFVTRVLLDLVQEIDECVQFVEFCDRGDYEIVRIVHERGISEVDITGASLSEIAIAVIEAIGE